MTQLRLLLVALLCGSLAAAGCEVWYVNNLTGDDGHDGRGEANAFKTLKRAVQALRPGDELNLANTGQPYYETLRLTGRMGTAAEPLVINGHGAVLSGLEALDPAAWQPRGAGFFYPLGKQAPNLHPWLYLDDRRVPEAASEAACEPGQSRWLGDGFFYRPADPAVLSGGRLCATLLNSGFAGVNLRHAICRDLVSERHSNDGFNLHGSCYGVFFENIESRENGDDGFSIHEDAQIVVRGGWFHHNGYGIEDIQATQSLYIGVTLSDNETGVHFSGGRHFLIDCVLRGNSTQVSVNGGVPSVYGGSAATPVTTATACHLKNCEIRGGDRGVSADGRSQVTVLNTLISECRQIGVQLLGTQAELTLSGCVVNQCGQLEARFAGPALREDHNLYFPGRIEAGGKRGGVERLHELNPESGSLAADPRLTGDDRQYAQEQPFARLSPHPVTVGLQP